MTKHPSENLEHLRHSLAHLLAAAVQELYPDAKRAIGPAIETGFYYDFEFAEPISEHDLPRIEKRMRRILPSWKSFDRQEVSPTEAKKLFAGNPYKLELIEEFAGQKEPLTVYTSGQFTDLCRGGHVDSLAGMAPTFKLQRLASAYWRGDEKNKQLTRIYGLAFATDEELQAHLTQLEEAKKRDHKKLGPELDLFTFSELVGSGLPLWTPRGTILRNLLDSFVWELRQAAGYELVDIPHITKKDLYETSGHWEKFSDELFKITTREKHVFVVKPMNCPHHTQLYARRPWSYRDLPQRYASTTKVYRDEQSGELGGLTRVRAITQDDAHVFCRANQVETEIESICDIVETFYQAAGFSLTIRLSLHDPKEPKKYLGTPAVWQESETTLRRVMKKRKQPMVEAVGEAAFYGPKLDYLAKDSLGREWQVATIQLDMNMPERFDLVCTNEKGQPERIVMLHAAIMGSIERYLAILIEHFAGAFPLWLSPVQIAVVPVTSHHVKQAEKLAEEFRTAGLRVEVSDANETVGKKIREATKAKIPYLLVIGDKEAKNSKLSVRVRGSEELVSVAKTAFVKQLAVAITKRSIEPPLA